MAWSAPLPAPHQVAADTVGQPHGWPPTRRNLLFHVAVTAQSTLVGFVIGTLLGLVLAVLHRALRTLDRALLFLDRGLADRADAGHRAHRAGDPGHALGLSAWRPRR